jgi:hypothetical protein
MILSQSTKDKFKAAEQMVIDGWSMTYALNKSGLHIGNQKGIELRKSDEYKNLSNLYFKIKYNRQGERYGFME